MPAASPAVTPWLQKGDKISDIQTARSSPLSPPRTSIAGGSGDARRNSDDAHDEVERMVDELADAMVMSWGRSFFVPLDALYRIITPDRVRAALSSIETISADVEDLSKQICGSTVPRPSKRATVTVCRRIFAILIYIGKGHMIQDFVEQGLSDRDLPFQEADTADFQLQRNTRGGPAEILSLFNSSNWRSIEKRLFYRNQWSFLAPYFRFSTDSQLQVLHYEFDDKLVLPILPVGGIGGASVRSGPYATIEKVKIHPGHYIHPSVSTTISIPWTKLRVVQRDNWGLC